MNWTFFINTLKAKIFTYLLKKRPLHIKQQVSQLMSPDPEYFAWLMQHKLQDTTDIVTRFPIKTNTPIFSILLPVFNTEEKWLKLAIHSVLNQTVDAYELIICNDASHLEETQRTLAYFQQQSDQITITRNEINQGISESTNRAASLAKGQFLIFLDHDDMLYPDALFTLYNTIQHNEADIYYSDEDRYAAKGFRYKHNFKPGFSPSLLETHNYILHLMCIKKTAFDEVGGMRKAFDGSQDYDLLLRLFDKKKRFLHIPHILYSWGESQTSMVGGELKPKVFINGKNALLEHFSRKSENIIKIEDSEGESKGQYHVFFELPKKINLLVVKTHSLYFPFDLPVPKVSERYQITCIDADFPFLELADFTENYDVILFLQAGLQPENWEIFLVELVSWTMRDEIGIVSGKILSLQKQVLHAGLSLFPSGRLQRDFYQYQLIDNPVVNRLKDCFSVDGNLLAISKPKLLDFLTQTSLDSDTWFIELCLKAQQLNLRVVYNPYAVAYFHGNTTTWNLPQDEKLHNLLRTYHITQDPYFNPNLYSQWNDLRLPPQLPKEKEELPHQIEPVVWMTKPDSDFQAKIDQAVIHPLFSILLPITDANPLLLLDLLYDISQQTYQSYEIICCSEQENIIQYLKFISEKTNKIKLIKAQKGENFAYYANMCLNAAKGDFVLFCHPHDRIDPHALAYFVLYVNQHPQSELIYCDDDQISSEHHRHDPHFKPDWNPDLFMSQLYFSWFTAIKKTLIQEYQLQFNHNLVEKAQYYDFLLQLTEKTKNILHVPHSLYSKRSGQLGIIQHYAYEGHEHALIQAIKRRQEKATVIHASQSIQGVYRIKRSVKTNTISHIIQAKTSQVFTTIESIQAVSHMPIEIIVMFEEDQQDLANQIQSKFDIKVGFVKKNANRAHFYNQGAKLAENHILFFSPEEIVLTDCDYPTAMIEHTQRPDIGAVGCKLLYPNGTFYHTGLLLGVNEFCGYAHRFMWQGPGYWFYPQSIRNYTAVSWDLLAVEKVHWETVDGFDESLNLFADVDFCLKLQQLGLRQVYTPYVCAILQRDVHSLEELKCERFKQILLNRYGEAVLNDPHYHPSLTKNWENFALS